MLHKIKTKQLVRQMALRFRNFGTDVDCLRINASSSVELVMDVSEEQTDLFFIIVILEMFLESHITFLLDNKVSPFLIYSSEFAYNTQCRLYRTPVCRDY